MNNNNNNNNNSSTNNNNNNTNIIDPARHLCLEARIVLTSLRNGPPHVARGELAQDLMELRDRIPRQFELEQQRQQQQEQQRQQEQQQDENQQQDETQREEEQTHDDEQQQQQQQQEEPSLSADKVQFVENQQQQYDTDDQANNNTVDYNDEYYAMPFLNVVMDPRASGPHTLVSLRAIYRLLQQGTFQHFDVSQQQVAVAILQTKFEQTDAGADEAVEMAIADVLAKLISIDCNNSSSGNNNNRILPTTIMEAFNTVFVTRNTFVHSPALCYHFEDVLSVMVQTMFFHSSDADGNEDNNNARNFEQQRLILEFLVNQLLHTPLVGGDGLDESTREAQIAHDATRVLCLRLVRIALSSMDFHSNTENNNELIQIIQDDLCLSLLMTGQAIWAYHDSTTNISPGFVSLEVLSEICATLSQLWNTLPLRKLCVAQFETIFTGFYTRALVLLRKRKQASNSISFNANLIFDSEVEIILESLVDILCLHDHGLSVADGDGGALETLFAFYDCDLRRSDVAVGLMIELCRCCGGTVNEDGDFMLSNSNSGIFGAMQQQQQPAVQPPIPLQQQVPATPANSEITSEANNNNNNSQETPSATSESGADAPSDSAATSKMTTPVSPVDNAPAAASTTTTALPAPATPTPVAVEDDSSSLQDGAMIQVEHPWRQVPAHLKELCAQALMGGMKCLFRDDHPSAETMMERHKRKRSIMSPSPFSGQISPEQAKKLRSSHILRDIKSKKRLMRKAARIFNKKASRGLTFLVDSGLIPDPPTPESVASFLRNGIVVELDKKAVGQYLGEAGKGPAAGKSPPDWERDWFHKDVLTTYCSLFRFEDQSLLDGLRMFLAAFRLPGEAQQIDRILQAFADTCGQVCEESANRRLHLFSDDPKRASDTAYLLSFSIIMLNTDQHNNNIREDRKMKIDDFVRNNTDYGRDITEKGKELPREYLEGIYESIKEEEIRTEGEGADGAMTVERWKDVLRGSPTEDKGRDASRHPTLTDAEDLTELVVEHVWKPIVSAIGAFWGITRSTESDQLATAQMSPSESAQSGMLGVQGARLGMDMSVEMLNGVRQLGRIDIFRMIFRGVCEYTGLLGEHYNTDSVERTWHLTNSVEAQSAVVVAIRTALEAGEDLDEDGWKRLWCILFELRDLKMVCHGTNGRSILHESDQDLLSEEARRDWIMCLVKGDMDFDTKSTPKKTGAKVGLLGAFGRALFGSDDDEYDDSVPGAHRDVPIDMERTAHGKEDLVVWDETAPSDDEDEDHHLDGDSSGDGLSPGAQFEAQLIRESLEMSQRMEMPVTGLERMDETRRYQISPRARVRDRFRLSCNFKALVSDTRFMEDSCVRMLLKSLIEIISANSQPPVAPPPILPREKNLERSGSDTTASSGSFVMTGWHTPLSPASEAFAEVLVSEVTLRNKDRIKGLWADILQDHYLGRLTGLLVNSNTADGDKPVKVPVDPGLEKRITGLLRLSICAIQREDLANEILPSWKYVLPMNSKQHASSPLRALDRHMGEGLWRLVANVDGLITLDQDGWEGVMSLLNWCAIRGGMLKPKRSNHEMGGHSSGLAEDDPALQAYRSLHLLLHTQELHNKVPCSVVDSLRALTYAGGTRNYPQLSIAALDLLHVLHDKKISSAQSQEWSDAAAMDAFWSTCWRKIVEGIAECAERSADSVSDLPFSTGNDDYEYGPPQLYLTYCYSLFSFSVVQSVRQHSLSMLTDLFLDKHGTLVPINYLCGALSEVCVPLAGRCIVRLQMGDTVAKNADELMIEFELSIGLIFKPLRHHLKTVLDAGGSLSSIWKSVLKVLEELLNDNEPKGADSPGERHQVIPQKLKKTMNGLVNEHLQNAIMFLIQAGVLLSDPKAPDDITAITWESVGRMGVSEGSLKKWKHAASQT